MSDFKDVGKDLGETREESEYNVDRVKINFPYSQRSVDDVNVYNTYRKEFNLREGKAVSLDLEIKERPEPCSVNPPEFDSHSYTTWDGDYVAGPCGSFNETGGVINWTCTGESANTGGYEIVGLNDTGGAVVLLPYDGCYLIEGTWGGYGVTYFSGTGSCEFGILKQGKSAAEVYTLHAGGYETGAISILGPSIYYTPAPNRLIGIVEAKAGDSVSLTASAGGFNRCKPWYGTYLRGMYVLNSASLKITLVAFGEDVLPLHEEYGTGGSSEAVAKAKRCILGTKSINILDGLVDFYDRLTAKGELPYPNQLWTPEEHWSNFWADYWARLGWTSNTGDYPFPAPQTILELTDYQTEWLGIIADCPPREEIYNVDVMYPKILNQLTLLRNFYTSTPNIPFYMDISGSTEPWVFESWETFWAWVWDRGYNMATHAYDMDYVWSEDVFTQTGGITPWPPARTIGEIDSYIELYTFTYIEPPPPEPPPPPPSDYNQISVGRGEIGITITASNTVIENYVITGPGADHAFDGGDNSFGIYGSGAFSNITIRNCVITGFGHTGIFLTNGSGGYITNLIIENCVIEDTVYGGILVLGVNGGVIRYNTVRRVGYGAGYDQVNGNSYGIGVTMTAYGGYPSQNVIVNNNIVEDVPLWHGLDTHGGIGLVFRYNTVRRCARAIFITAAADANNEFAENCIIEYNLFTYPQSNPSRMPPGTDDGIAMTEYAGINNTFRYNHIGDSAITGHQYANIYYDTGGLSTGTVLLDNVRSETLPTVASAGTRYISPTGSDASGNGTLNSPWLSIQKFIDSNPVAGSTLYVLGGTYTNARYSRAGWYELPLIGTTTAPITIAAYPGTTPVFSGGSGPILGLSECSYVIVDGLSFINRDIGDSGYIFTGAFNQSGYPAHHITIRNCTFNFSLTGQATTEHAVYLSSSTENVTVEDCIFLGPGIGNGGGYGLHAYASVSNGPRNLTVRRNVFKGWNQAGIVLWNSAITADIIHNTFILNATDIRLEVFSDTEVRDCAFDSPSGTTAIRGTPTSASYNFFSQSFSSSYYLTAGQTGINAASDGTDAGALDSNTSTTTTSYYISPTGSDTTGNGSINNPWATINKWVGNVGVDSAPVAGSTLYLRGGTYTAHGVVYIGRHDSGVDTNNLYGAAGAPITIRNYPGETPVFSGGTGTLLSICKATYLVIDGIQIQNRPGLQTGHITTGQWPAAGPWGPADNITIRNCTFSMATGEGDNGYHNIYATAGTKDLIVEYCRFFGPATNVESDGGYGFHAYEGYREAMTGIICRYNIFVGWEQAGATIFGGSVKHSGSITHNTFIDCRWNIRIENYNTILVRDNAGESGSEANLMNDSSGTLTADHNFWGQEFSPTYYLLEGETGIRAASDGTDAGALNSNISTFTGYYISPSGSDTTGTGTISKPWASINKFINSSPSPGDILYCRGGNYSTAGNVSLRIQGISGTSGSPITIRNYPGETPIFHGTGAAYTWLMFFQDGSSYWVVDGLHTARDYVPTSTGVIVVYNGGDYGSGIAAHHITIRNCHMVWRRYMTVQDQLVYLSAGADNCIVENNIFEGEWVYGDANGGCGVNIGDHEPAPANFLIQRNIFKGLSKAMWINGSSICTGSILHNTFISNDQHIRAYAHGLLTIRDNAGEDALSGASSNIVDGNPSATTADHNFWNQQFDSSYYLLAGETGRSAASDGTDAGALDW